MEKSWSFWERDILAQKSDVIVVGAGFTGLSTALHLKKLKPRQRVLVLERALYAEGASSKNAGFACYGTIGEILDDIASMGEEGALDLVQKRQEGLRYLRQLIGDDAMDYQSLGGTEVFLKGEESHWEKARGAINRINQSLGLASNSRVFFSTSTHYQSLKEALGSIHSSEEGQLHPVKALRALESACRDAGVEILYGIEVLGHQKRGDWLVQSREGSWPSKKLIYCTNAFGYKAQNLEIKPARNQVLMTNPIKHDLPPGNYHAQAGYLYFRTVGARLLIGGARHLDLEAEMTVQMGSNDLIIDYLKQFLNHQLKLENLYELNYQWSGIIATAQSKEPQIRRIDQGLWYCGRFGGMGVALSCITGRNAAELLDRD